MEEWRSIPGLDASYEVSNYGRVRSVGGVVSCGLGRMRGYKSRILTPQVNNKGYLRICMCGKYWLIHKLVAQAFVPNPDNYPIVNHKDENRQNNCADNLEWCTYKYNSNYGTIKNKISEKMKKKPIIQIYKNGTTKIWHSLREIERVLGYSHANIAQCCKHKYDTAYGCKWEYFTGDIL